MSLAPVILFAYKRPLHTLKTLEALEKNTVANQTILYVFVDGLKTNATLQDKKEHNEVIQIVNSKKWCLQTNITVSSINKGLANSVIKGVSSILNQYNKAIILEDDLVTSPFFLEYMNNALMKYENTPEVACISGYVYPLQKTFDSAFFIKGSDCWGWGTWKDKWNSIFNENPNYLFQQLNQKKLSTEFDFNNSYPYTQMLIDRIHQKNQSWAVLWYASAFLQNKLCLYPPQSLVHNIGNDGSGTHSSSSTNSFNVNIFNVIPPSLPNEIGENKDARIEFELFFRKLIGNKEKTILDIVKQKIKKILG